MQNTKEIKKSTWKALLFSFLTCLGFSVLWGLIYYLGYIAYIVGFACAVCSYAMFVKFYKKVPFWSVLWVLFFSIILTELAMMIVILIIFISAYPNMTLGEGIANLYSFIADNAELSKAFLSDTLLNVILITIGVITTWVGFYIKNKKVAKKQAIIQNSQQNNETSYLSQEHSYANEYDYTNKEYSYEEIKNAYREVIEEYKYTKDKSILSSKLTFLREKYLKTLSPKGRSLVIKKAQNDLKDVNISTVDKLTLNTILKNI